MTEGLPADDERRTFTVVYTAYLALSLTDPALAIAPLVRNSTAVSDVIAAQLRAAQAADATPVHLDPDLEALSLLAMSAGLGTSVRIRLHRSLIVTTVPASDATPVSNTPIMYIM